jgi:hypothetical protein
MAKSMVQGAVSNNGHALWWSQWLLQVQFTFVSKKILEVEVIWILPKRIERAPLFGKKCLLDINICYF